MIGGNSPQKWLQQLGVPYVDKPHSWSPPRTDHLSAKTAEGLIPSSASCAASSPGPHALIAHRPQ